MAGNPNPYVDPDPWGKVVVIAAGASYIFPGIIDSIDGAEKPEVWIYQMGIATMNAVSIWRGRKLAESIKVSMRLYDRVSFEGIYDIQKALRPPGVVRPPTAMVINPIINHVGVSRVSLKNIVPPKPAAGLSWTYQIELGEYNPMKAAPVGPADPPKKETENDRKQRYISNTLLPKIAKLGFP